MIISDKDVEMSVINYIIECEIYDYLATFNVYPTFNDVIMDRDVNYAHIARKFKLKWLDQRDPLRWNKINVFHK